MQSVTTENWEATFCIARKKEMTKEIVCTAACKNAPTPSYVCLSLGKF